jgi:signal transduction histidine kinase
MNIRNSSRVSFDAVASLARGTMTLRREWIDVRPAVEAAVESCSWGLMGSGHSLWIELPDAALHAYVDAAGIRQIVTNLLDNACKYTQTFGRIRLTLRRTSEHAVLVVEGNGIDIASERQGVDFNLVREIVELHGGNVAARSAGPGAASAFVVRLPVRHPGLSSV